MTGNRPRKLRGDGLLILSLRRINVSLGPLIGCFCDLEGHGAGKCRSYNKH